MIFQFFVVILHPKIKLIKEIMRFAVIAAGEGSRLQQEGVEQPKPLVPLCGEPMIERLLRIFVDCGATEIVVIVNEWSVSVREHLQNLHLPVPLRLVVKTTPSSMHSLHALSPYLRGERFCLTTVDTIFREEEFKRYIRHFVEATDTGEVDGCMAVTPYVDDEKPLWVGVDKNRRITGFHDQQEGDDHLISGGIYCLGDKALDVLDHCMEQGMSRMRNFQRQLVAEGLRLDAYSIPKILDVDHKEDIDKAIAFIHPLAGKKVMGVCRGNAFSPNCVDNDAAIMQAVKKQIESLGAEVELCGEDDFCHLPAYEADGYFSMARGKEALSSFRQIELRGGKVLNSCEGIARCIRRSMTESLVNGGISHPRSWVIEKGGKMPAEIDFPCWLKRGDGCAQQKEDTCFVKNVEEGNACLEDFWRRGVECVIINEHLTGDLIKFYGVEGTSFFHWLYPSTSGHPSKFGLEEINGVPQGYGFDEEQVKAEADKASRLLDVPVYGGDCIVDKEGNFKIIDFNDWPSFAPCREQAAYYIAQCFVNMMNA